MNDNYVEYREEKTIEGLEYERFVTIDCDMDLSERYGEEEENRPEST
jgi:hypothetical protein